MPFRIVRNDISSMTVDAIVNSTHPLGDNIGGVETKLFEVAGDALYQARQSLGVIQAGDVKYTQAFKLSANYVFHTVGPTFQGDTNDEHNVLSACYENSLDLAKRLNLASIAFPLIASGSFKFPKSQALSIAVESIKAFLHENDLLIYLVVYDKESYALSTERYESVQSYINENTVVTLREQRHHVYRQAQISESIADFIDTLEKTFSEALLERITATGKTDQEIYKKANIDRKLFSKIRSNRHYQPSKNTAMALGLALELDLKAFNDLIAKAGYTLSASSKTDLIIQYYIDRKVYDLFEINTTLFEFTNRTL